MNKTPAPTEHVKHPLALFPPQYADHSWQLAVYRHAEDRFVFEKRVVDVPVHLVLIIVKIYEYNRIVAFRYLTFYT